MLFRSPCRKGEPQPYDISPGNSPRPACRFHPGSYEVTAFALSPGTCETVCVSSKNEVYASPHCPRSQMELLQSNHPVPLGAGPVLSPGTPCPEGRPSPLLLGEPQFKAVVTQAAAALSSLLDPSLAPLITSLIGYYGDSRRDSVS